MQNIRYKLNFEKAIEAIVWLAKQNPGIDIYHISKAVFFADKLHINRYARPIFGDTYFCAPYGPLPSGIHNLLSKDSWTNPLHLAELERSVEIKGRYKKTKAKRDPDMDFFSGTDVECLKEGLEKVEGLSFEDLYNITHDEKCYYESTQNLPIDYALMVDDDNPNRDLILEEMSETARYAQL